MSLLEVLTEKIKNQSSEMKLNAREMQLFYRSLRTLDKIAKGQLTDLAIIRGTAEDIMSDDK